MAFQILEYVLLDAPGASLKKALLDAGIGDDIMGGYEYGILQPYFSVIAKNAEREQKDEFVKIVKAELKKLADGGIDKKCLKAGINNYEFQYREADYAPRRRDSCTVSSAWTAGSMARSDDALRV